MTKYLLCGASSLEGVNNFGDQLIKKIFIEKIKQFDPSANIEFFEFRGAWKSKIMVESVKNAQKLIFIGGGYLGEPNFPGRLFPEAYARRMIWGIRNYNLYGRLAALARKFGIPYAILGVEYGPISNPIFRLSSVRMLNEAEIVSLRTAESVNFARKYGVQRKIHLSSDIVLTLKPTKTATDKKNNYKLSIGLHIHDFNLIKKSPEMISAINKILVDCGRDREIDLVYVHDQNFSGNPKKRAVSAEKFFNEIHPNIRIYKYTDPKNLVDFISTLDLVITTKLHVGITARALSVPVISFPNHQKTIRFYNMIEEGWRVLSFDEINETRIAHCSERIITEIIKNKSKIDAKHRRSSEKNINLLSQFILLE